MRKKKLSKRKKKNKNKEKENTFSECILIPAEAYYDLLRHRMVCQFIRDMQQNSKNVLEFDDEILDEASNVIDEATELLFRDQLNNGIILNDGDIIYVEG